jgi:lysozyme family protein
MASFEEFLPILLRFEGGFVNDPADPGGATNKGITLATFRQAGLTRGIADTSLDALKRLSDHDAGRIYKRLYWDKLCADDIGSQDLANLLVDFYVNAGGNAIKELQGALNDFGTEPPVGGDGAFGPATLDAVRRADSVPLYRALRRRRIEYYQRLAQGRPTLEKFLKGWLNRVAAFPQR